MSFSYMWMQAVCCLSFMWYFYICIRTGCFSFIFFSLLCSLLFLQIIELDLCLTEGGQGSITLQDLRRVAAAHDFTWSNKEMADMIQIFDNDGDGKVISALNFKCYLRNEINFIHQSNLLLLEIHFLARTIRCTCTWY